MRDVFIKLEEQLMTPQGRDTINRLQGNKNQFNANLNVRNELNKNKNGSFNNKQNIAGGSTINSALLVNNKIYVSNSGDSRCIIVEKTNNRLQVAFASKDHKPDLKEERKRIEGAGGFVS